MQPTLTVSEQRAPYWKGITLGSLIAAVLFFAGYIFIAHTFWAGIFRLIAFISLAVSILGFLKYREPKITLCLQFTPEHLMVTYLVKEKREKEELFERATIKGIEKQCQALEGGIIPKMKGCEYLITFTDTDRELVLFTFSGRDLRVSPQTAVQIDAFLEEYV